MPPTSDNDIDSNKSILSSGISILEDGKDGYQSSVISNGVFSSDPNYSSSLISIDGFTIIKVIGRGSFGKVYLVRKKDDGNVYAMKTLKKDMIIRKNQTRNTKGKLPVLKLC